MKVRIFIESNEDWDEEVNILISLPYVPRKGEYLYLCDKDRKSLEYILSSNIKKHEKNYYCFYDGKTNKLLINDDDCAKHKWVVNVADHNIVGKVATEWNSKTNRYEPWVELIHYDENYRL